MVEERAGFDPKEKDKARRETGRATGLTMAIYIAPPPFERFADHQGRSYQVSPHGAVE